MKKKDVVNLIRFHVEKDDESFINQSELMASEFFEEGDEELALYIKSLISPISTIIPQETGKSSRIGFLERVDFDNESLLIPDKLRKELVGVANASRKNIWGNKYLFYGEPGTGKTQAAYQISRLLKRTLWQVNVAQLIDSHLGETSKNIEQLFKDINEYPFKTNMVVLFDEIDSLALKRNDDRDLREMARATTELFKGLDSLSKEVVLIATTNLHKELDKALLRRFVARINFDVYSHDDLVNIGLHYYKYYCEKMEIACPYNSIIEKFLNSSLSLPNPGELKNMILTSLAFSDPKNVSEHLRRLFEELFQTHEMTDLTFLREELGLTIREVEALTGISKSEVSRRQHK